MVLGFAFVCVVVSACAAPLVSTALLPVGATAFAGDWHLAYSFLRDFIILVKGTPTPECQCTCSAAQAERGALESFVSQQLARKSACENRYSWHFYFGFNLFVLLLGFLAGWWCARRTVATGRLVEVPVPLTAGPSAPADDATRLPRFHRVLLVDVWLAAAQAAE